MVIWFLDCLHQVLDCDTSYRKDGLYLFLGDTRVAFYDPHALLVTRVALVEINAAPDDPDVSPLQQLVSIPGVVAHLPSDTITFFSIDQMTEVSRLLNRVQNLQDQTFPGTIVPLGYRPHSTLVIMSDKRHFQIVPVRGRVVEQVVVGG